MENNNTSARAENAERSADRPAAQASENLRELARMLYQCPGNGGIVSDPTHCRPMNGYQLPELSLEG